MREETDSDEETPSFEVGGEGDAEEENVSDSGHVGETTTASAATMAPRHHHDHQLTSASDAGEQSVTAAALTDAHRLLVDPHPSLHSHLGMNGKEAAAKNHQPSFEAHPSSSTQRSRFFRPTGPVGFSSGRETPKGDPTSSISAARNVLSGQSRPPETPFRRPPSLAYSSSSSSASSIGGVAEGTVVAAGSGAQWSGKANNQDCGGSAAAKRWRDDGFNSQCLHDDMEKTVEVIRGLQPEFSLPDRLEQFYAQTAKQLCQQVGDSSRSMVDAKVKEINERLDRLAKKYERIKQLEDQMKQSNQILDLLLERR